MNPLLKRSSNLILGMFVFLLVLNQLIGWAVTEKSWIENLWLTIVAGGGFGILGIGIGLIVGGIGVALGGGAIGIAGWLAGGVLGFGAGALGGSLLTIIQDPGKYDIDYFRLILVLVGAACAALISVLFASKLGKRITSYIKGPEEQIEET